MTAKEASSAACGFQALDEKEETSCVSSNKITNCKTANILLLSLGDTEVNHIVYHCYHCEFAEVEKSSTLAHKRASCLLTLTFCCSSPSVLLVQLHQVSSTSLLQPVSWSLWPLQELGKPLLHVDAYVS